MSQRFWIPTALAVLEAVALAVVCVFWLSARHRAERLEGPANELRKYCRLVHAALEIDEADFKDPGRRDAAAIRFFEPIANHSYREIMMCAKNRPDLSPHDACLEAKDYDCLAQLAKKSAEEVAAALED
jgi:hypothetical protein